MMNGPKPITARTPPADLPELALPWRLRDPVLFFEEGALTERGFQDLAKACGLPLSATLIRWYQSEGLLSPALLLEGERQYSRWQLLEVKELEDRRHGAVEVHDYVPVGKQDGRSWRKAITDDRRALFCTRPEYRRWLSLLVLIQNRYVARARGQLNEIQRRYSLGDEPWAQPYIEGREYAQRLAGDAGLREVGLTLETAVQLRQRIGIGVERDDSLKDWYRLVRFIPFRWRERLAGPVRLAQELYIADRMLQRFLSDVSGTAQPDLEDLAGPLQPAIHPLYGRAIDYRDPDFRELILTQFGLHPAPRGWIFCEGPTEVAVLEAIFDMFGFPAKYIGVEIESLEGVGNVVRMLEVVDRLRRPVTTGEPVRGHKMIQRPITAVWIVVDREGPIAGSVIPEMKKRGLEHCLVVADRDLERDNFAHELSEPLQQVLGQPVSSAALAEWANGVGSLEKFVKRKLAPGKPFRKLDLVPMYIDLLRADIEATDQPPFRHKFLNDALAIIRVILHDLPNPDPALKDLATL